MGWFPTSLTELMSSTFVPVIAAMAFVAYLARVEKNSEDKKRVTDPEVMNRDGRGKGD